MTANVALCQMGVRDLDIDANVETVESHLAGLPPQTSIACFPECALTGFVPDDRLRQASIPIDSWPIDRIRDAAGRAQLDVLIGLVEMADDRYYNTAAYVREDGTVETYRKRHLWGSERDVLAPGRERLVLDTPVGRAGVLTCFDLNFVHESAWFTDRRIDVLFVLGAWPLAHRSSWELLLRARALDGVRWTVGVSRTGRRDVPDAEGIRYAGDSLVVKPDGSPHASIDRNEETLLVELDHSTLIRDRERIGIPGDWQRPDVDSHR